MKKIGLIMALIGAFNFVAYCAIAAAVGGDAINGKAESGRYYLAEHGKLTEVSKEVFTYSRYHTFSLWVTHPLAMLGIVIFGVSKKDEEDAKTRTKA